MDCQRVSEFFSDHLEGTVDASIRTAIESHVALCAECREELSGLKLLYGALEAVPEVEPPADGAWKVLSELRRRRAEEYERQRDRTPTLWERMRGWSPLRTGLAAGVATLIIGGSFLASQQNVLQMGFGPARKAPQHGGPVQAAIMSPGVRVQFGAPTADGQPILISVAPNSDLNWAQLRVSGRSHDLGQHGGAGTVQNGQPAGVQLTLPTSAPAVSLKLELEASTNSGQEVKREYLVVVPVQPQRVDSASFSMVRESLEKVLLRIAPALGRPIVSELTDGVADLERADIQPNAALELVAGQLNARVQPEADLYRVVAPAR